MINDGSYSLYIMGLICFAFVLVFAYFPLCGWIIAFTNYKPGYKLEMLKFEGLKWFRLALEQPQMPRILRNTLMMSFLGLATAPIPMVFALLLSEMRSQRYKRVIQTITTFPNFIGWILVYVIALNLFAPSDGLVNMVLKQLGMERIQPMSNINIAWTFQTALGVWKGAGYSAVVYLAAISGIDTELYDAADVDGADRFDKIWHIKVPALLPTFFVLFLLSIGNLLSSGFERYLFFYNGMVSKKIEVLDYYLYRIGIVTGNYALSTAVGLLKSVISIILLTFANVLSKKIRGVSIL